MGESAHNKGNLLKRLAVPKAWCGAFNEWSRQTSAEFMTKRLRSHTRLVTIHPADRQDVHRRRRGLINGVQGMLFLPAQGVCLTVAIPHGGIWWVIWGIVLSILIGAVAIGVRFLVSALL